MKTLAAVLLQLDLFDADSFGHLTSLFSFEEAVSKSAIDRSGLPLLSDLISSLKFKKNKTLTAAHQCCETQDVCLLG